MEEVKDKTATSFPNDFVLNLALAGFAIIASLWSLLMWSEGSTSLDPLWRYYEDSTIRLIYFAGLGIDVGIVVVTICWVAFNRRGRNVQAGFLSQVLILLALAAAALTWIEIWYGSGLNYDNRDKQGLPFAANHFGPVGSFLCLVYVLLRLPPGRTHKSLRRMFIGVGILVLFVGHWLILHFFRIA